MLLQVGFKSLSYEMQKQEPAYDSNSLFGKKRDFRSYHVIVRVRVVLKRTVLGD